MRNGLIGGLLGGLIVAAGFFVLDRTSPDETIETNEPVPTEFATVIVTDLVETETLAGNLRFREPSTVRAVLAGTVTRLPDAGDLVGPDQVLFEIDGRPVYVLDGARPAWRSFADGMEEGADVLQLESELARLGFLDEQPDEEFDDETATAVEDWRESVGLPEDDVIELGRVVFLPETIRVGSAFVEVGQTVAPGVSLFEVTSRDQEVYLELDPEELDLVAEGMVVTVILPDDREIRGRVSEIGRSARAVSPDPDAPVVIGISVSVEGTALDLDQAPVDVEVETDRAAGVLAVPVRALVSLSGGGYALEVERGGLTELVGVEIGQFADGLVEVSGGVVEGDRVVIPR